MHGISEARSKRALLAAVAVAVAAIMVFSAVPLDTDTSSADGALPEYRYTIEVADGSEPTAGVKEGSWKFDETTGYGPFNSFYAAFDGMTGQYLGRLNPNDLSTFVEGEANFGKKVSQVASDGIANVMWVLPEVYWKVNDDGNLVLSNDSGSSGFGGSQGFDYAHHIDDSSFTYVAYGVYEASTYALGDGAKAMGSVPGVTPEHASLADKEDGTAGWYTYAENTPAPRTGNAGSAGTSMVWNIFQWEMYKYLAYTVLGGFDSQGIVGKGYTNSSNKEFLDTGTMDEKGPIWGETEGTAGAKLFLENTWGSLNEWVGGYSQSGSVASLTTRSNPGADPANWGDHYTVPDVPTGSGPVRTVDVSDDYLWGFPSGFGGSTGTGGTYDFAYLTNADNYGLYVGGGYYQDGFSTGTQGNNAGISYVGVNQRPDNDMSKIGSRLAFAFNADRATIDPPADKFTYVLKAEGNPSALSVECPSVPLRIDSVHDDLNDRVMQPIVRGADGKAQSSDWKFDDRGYGPFNSFYALFDGRTGGMMCHLDPGDLKKQINGDVADLEGNNVMWVLPKVYWGTDGSGNLVLTNQPSAAGVADLKPYAHTVDGREYAYLAIGVYEGSQYDIDEKGAGSETGTTATALGSRSGQDPLQGKTLGDLQAMAGRTPVSSRAGDSAIEDVPMIWNFYQWELYKYVSYAVMGDFDSQKVVGMGSVDSAIAKTGQMNGLGPFYGTEAADQKGAKLFIENAWGSAPEFVCGFWQDGATTYLSQASAPEDKETTEQFGTVSVAGYPGNISRAAANWGWAAAGGEGSESTALADWTVANAAVTGHLLVGGGFDELGNRAGISFAEVREGNPVAGSRLAFVFGADTAAPHTLSYDPNYEGAAPMDGKTVYAGHDEPLATPPDRAGYNFVGWHPDGRQGVAYVPGYNYQMPDRDVTMFAEWDPIDYHVTIRDPAGDCIKVMNGETQMEDGGIVHFGDVLTVTVERPGYTSTVTPSVGSIDEEHHYTVEGNVTFTAEYSAMDYTVDFDADGGSAKAGSSLNTITVTYGSTYGKLPEVEKGGYRFLGWYIDDKRIESDETVTITAPSTAVAHWVQQFEVTAVIENGTADPVTQTVDYGADSQKIEFTADAGYHIVSVTVGGREIPVNETSFEVGPLTDVTAVQTITAKTAANPTVHYEQGPCTEIRDRSPVDGGTVDWKGKVTFSIGPVYPGYGGTLNIECTMGGAPVDYIPNGDGTYSVADVTGDVVVSTSLEGVTIRTVTIAPGDSHMGSVSKDVVYVPDGAPIEYTDVRAKTITVGTTGVTATEEDGYRFVGWEGLTEKVTGDMAIKAVFDILSSDPYYEVKIVSNDTSMGTVSPAYLLMGEGTGITLSGLYLEIGIEPVDAVPKDDSKYELKGWEGAADGMAVTGNMAIKAVFGDIEDAYCKVSFDVNRNDLGSVSVPFVYVPSGSPVAPGDHSLDVGGRTVKAAENTGDAVFIGWSAVPYAITSDITITAMFEPKDPKEEDKVYKVTFGTNNEKLGTVGVGYVCVASGSKITEDAGHTLTVGTTEIPVSAADGCSLKGWEGITGERVTGPMAVTAVFGTADDAYCKVTFGTNDEKLGTVGTPYVLVPGGSAVNVNGSTMEIAGRAVDAVEKDGAFRGWSVVPVTITSDIGINAMFEPKNSPGEDEKVRIVTFGTNDEKLGTVSVRSMAVMSGAPVAESGSVITVGVTDVAAHTIGDAVFRGWGAVPYAITSDITITAMFEPKDPKDEDKVYKVTFGTNDEGRGTVGLRFVNVPSGTSVTVGEGHSLSIGDVEVPVHPADGNELKGWSGLPGTVTSDITVTAVFGPVGDDFRTVIFDVNDRGLGTVDPVSLIVPDGSEVSVADNRMEIGGSSVTAAATGGIFRGWSVVPFRITSDTAIEAMFEPKSPEEDDQKVCIVNFRANEERLGTVDVRSMSVPYGTEVTAVRNTMTIGGNTVTANAAEGTFAGWSRVPVEITASMAIEAMFEPGDPEEGAEFCTVTFGTNDGSLGTVDLASVTVRSGAAVAVDRNVMTVGEIRVTATPAGDVMFRGWSVVPVAITSDIGIDAMFQAAGAPDDGKVCVVDFGTNDAKLGTVDVRSVAVPYGTAVTAERNTMAIGGSTVTASSVGDNVFRGWSEVPVEIVCDITINAMFEPKDAGDDERMCTVTFGTNDPSLGTVNVRSMTVLTGTVVEVPSGTVVVAEGDVLTVGEHEVTAVAIGSGVFRGWSIVPEKVTADIAVTAMFEAADSPDGDRFHTVSFGTNDAELGNVDVRSVTVPAGTAVIVDGNVMTVGTQKVAASAAGDGVFRGWSAVPARIVSDIAINAMFEPKNATESERMHLVTFTSADAAEGTVDLVSMTVAHGTPVAVDGTALTVGGLEVTATPADGYRLSGWTGCPDAVVADVTVTAAFVEDYSEKPGVIAWLPAVVVACIIVSVSAGYVYRRTGL